MFLKHLTLIIQEKLVGTFIFYDPKKKDFLLDFVEFLIAISVTSHGDIREKLNMAFNMYGKEKY
jgi:Ca2+-binding EF-hand superfamily protein